MLPSQIPPTATQCNIQDETSASLEEVSYVDLVNPLEARFDYEMPSLSELGLDKPVEAIRDLVPLFMFELEKNYKYKVLEIMRAKDVDEHYSLVISLIDLLNSSPGLFNAVIKYPAVCLPLLDDALIELMTSLEQLSIEEDVLIPKENAHVRIFNLPQVPAYSRTSIPTSDDVGKLISVTATVTRSGVANMAVEMRMFECTKCRASFPVVADVDRNCQIVPPVVCLGNVEQGCKSTKFKPIHEDQAHQGTIPLRTYQEIKVQEQVNKLSLGTIPRSIIVVLQDDLIDSAKSGDDVLITGMVRRRWKNVVVGDRCQIELYILACHVHVRNDARSEFQMSPEQCREFEEFWELHQSRPLEGRNLILASFSPKIFGLHLVKLSVMLALVGGVQKVGVSNHRVRGEPHLLLVGDPGTGKSQFLKFAAKLIPRSVLTTGIGSSSAGLTVTATMDKGEWQLEAGALVLADRGLCCIDEFNSIREHDKVAIHEAMEQQSISIAKAGMVCRLNSRCSVIAATNPKGKYDPNQSLSVNLALASPLLSRFDLILVLLDTQNENWDKLVSSFILQSECEQIIPKEDCPQADVLWSVDKLKAYIAYVKQKLMPRMTQECEEVLSAYYQLQRSTDQRSAARTTLRLLESLIRLSQAHARLMFRDEATVLDAIQVILIMEYSMANSGSGLASGDCFPTKITLQSSSPDNPDMIYRRQEKAILTKLGLANLASQPILNTNPNRELFEDEDDGSSLGNPITQQTTPKPIHPFLQIPKPPTRRR